MSDFGDLMEVKLRLSEMRGVEEARRVVGSMDPMSVAFLACWLNATVKRTIETSGPSGEVIRKMLENYERQAIEQMKAGGF